MVSTAAAQLGILAACVVLFVPMGLAGFHLSRNKMLFFSGALFITLAVLVHVSPYLPSLFPTSLPPLAGPTPLACIDSLPSSVLFLEHPLRFSFRSTATCRFQKISRPDALDLLNGTWILNAGDSQSRIFVLSLLSLLLEPSAVDSIQADLFRRHSDYQIQIADAGIRLDFLWSPFESNISSSIQSLGNQSQTRPDVVIAGSGLWHMLHVTNSTDYGENLVEIKGIVKKDEIFTSASHMFWMGLPRLLVEKLNTEEKMARMNSTMQERYNAEVEKSGILRREGGPFLLLDLGALSQGCGPQCTADGMHYEKVVYDAAVQVMLNALLIETQQMV